jgi:DNA repair protein RadA/Sms
VAQKDVFLNMAGGLRIDEPAVDLAVITAILSSNEDIPSPPADVFAGEVGLSGEIRPVNLIDQRISEADKLGFERIWISAQNSKGWSAKDYKIEVCPVKTVEELFSQLFG